MFARTHSGPEGANGNGKIAQSYIAGIGASGALLAGAVVTFVFLVGAVSFQVWPAASDGGSGAQSLPVAELAGPSVPGGAGGSSLGDAVVALASAVPVDAKALSVGGGGGIQGRGESDQGSGGSVGTPPVDTGGSGGSGGSGTAGEEPTDPPSSGGGSDRPSSGNSGQGDRGNSGSSGGSTGTGTGTTQTGTGSTGSTGSDHTQRGNSRGR